LNLPMAHDRVTGVVTKTLVDIAALASLGQDMLDAWRQAGPDTGDFPNRMAEPHVMASIHAQSCRSRVWSRCCCRA